jgi:hypothetical protein
MPGPIGPCHFKFNQNRGAASRDAALEDSRSVCVIVPGHREAKAVSSFREDAGVTATIIGPDDYDEPDSRSA